MGTNTYHTLKYIHSHTNTPRHVTTQTHNTHRQAQKRSNPQTQRKHTQTHKAIKPQTHNTQTHKLTNPQITILQITNTRSLQVRANNNKSEIRTCLHCKHTHTRPTHKSTSPQTANTQNTNPPCHNPIHTTPLRRVLLNPQLNVLGCLFETLSTINS